MPLWLCLDEVKVSSNPIWKKLGAYYYTAQFPILSQVRTQTHARTRRIQNEAAAPNNLPDRLSDTKTGGQKGKDSYYVRQGLVTIQMRLYKDISHSHMEIITLDQAVVRQTRVQLTDAIM